jgi:hypothetical protein
LIYVFQFASETLGSGKQHGSKTDKTETTTSTAGIPDDKETKTSSANPKPTDTEDLEAKAPQSSTSQIIRTPDTDRTAVKKTVTKSARTPPASKNRPVKVQPEPDPVTAKKTDKSDPSTRKQSITPAQIKSKEIERGSEKYNSVRNAKIAYKQKKISKSEYGKIIRDLKIKLKQEIRQAKLDLRTGKITKTEYKLRIRDAELDYKGRR